MKTILYTLMIFTLSCGNKQLKLMKSINVENPLEKMTLIDTLKNVLKPDTASFIKESEFHPIYIGQKCDSIVLNYNSREIEQITFDWYQYRSPDSIDLKIFVDSTRTIGSAVRFFVPPPASPNSKERYEWKTKKYRGEIRSYPVMIENDSKDTLMIGYGDYIPLIIEAVDSLGKWRPI